MQSRSVFGAIINRIPPDTINCVFMDKTLALSSVFYRLQSGKQLKDKERLRQPRSMTQTGYI